MGGAGIGPETEEERKELERIQKEQISEAEKRSRSEGIRERAWRRVSSQYAAIADDLGFIQTHLGKLDGRVATPYRHQDTDISPPRAPKGATDPNYPDYPTINHDLNNCLIYLEEYTTGGAPSHVQRPQDGGKFDNYIHSFLDWIQGELKGDFNQVGVPGGNPPTVPTYQKAVNEIDWIFQKLNGIFGTNYLPPVYTGDAVLLLQSYTNAIAKMFGKI